jgi:metallo-beta-lactamase class B
MKTHRFLPWLVLSTCALQLIAQSAKVMTPEDIFRRNTEPREQTNKQFPPHKVIGNIYYVGSPTLASFLIVTPQGNVLINSCYEDTVPVIRASVEQLGFRFADTKILLGSHAHADHMQGDALVKELTGARVMAMEQDIPALTKITPGNKPHPIDRVLHDGDDVKLGDTTLIAHLTPGHTRGCTTWTVKTSEGGKTYDVVIVGSVGVNPNYQLVNNKDVPDIADEYIRSFKILGSLACDVPLGSHPGMYDLAGKYPKLGKGPSPFIDPEGYKREIDLEEQVFYNRLAEQKKASGQ